MVNPIEHSQKATLWTQTSLTNTRQGANQTIFQSTCCSAQKGDFFLWAVVKTIGRVICGIFSSIWHLVCCCPSQRLSWLSPELIKIFLDGNFFKLETLTKVRDGVFEVQAKDGKTGEFTFWINEKDELAWASTVNGEKIEENDLGSSFVFAHDPEEVPDKVAYYHRGDVDYLLIEDNGIGEHTIHGIAPREVRENFEKEFAKKSKFVWESHLQKKPDADLSSITNHVVFDMAGISPTTWVETTGPGEFILRDKATKIPVQYYVNTLDELVEVFPETKTVNIYGTQHFWKKHFQSADYRYVIYDSGKLSSLNQTWSHVSNAYTFTGIVTQSVFDQLNPADLDNSIWRATDPASTEVLKRNGFKYHEASKEWVRSEGKE